MNYRSPRLFCPLILLSLFALRTASGEMVTLYLLNGTVVRGEIVDRSVKAIDLKTPSGIVKVKASSLMSISRQQLRLPAEIEKEPATTPELDAVISQMEKVIAENEALRQQVVALKMQLAKTADATTPNPRPPAEGPVRK